MVNLRLSDISFMCLIPKANIASFTALSGPSVSKQKGFLSSVALNHWRISIKLTREMIWFCVHPLKKGCCIFVCCDSCWYYCSNSSSVVN